MKKNILIVHYNTPLLTERLVNSVNKYVSDAQIYIFDNSDKLPFTKTFENVTIIDNTKGDYINFDKWLSKYKNKNKSTGGTNNNYASAKHCYSVDFCMNIIKEPFVLLDSDVLVKKDFSDLYNENFIYCGEIINQGGTSNILRILPYICYINTTMCVQNNIRYFDETKMHGLFVSLDGDKYDTGSSFYYNSIKYKHKEISYTDYVVHYKAGSWKSNAQHNITPEEWLNANKRYWNLKENKKVVYTCITGGYDTLIDPKKTDECFDYVCFTDDKNLQSKVWEIRPMPKDVEELDNCRKQRFVKINPHIVLPEYDLSIWVDGNIEIKDTLTDFVENNNKDGVSIFIPKHPYRKCIYEESEACKRLKKDKDSIIDEQTNSYKKEGMPSNYGLPQSNIIIRKHHDETCIKLMEAWWYEVKNKSLRDQLSFTYALWKNKTIKVEYIDSKIYESKWFHLHNKHTRNRTTSNINITKQPNYRVAQPWFWR